MSLPEPPRTVLNRSSFCLREGEIKRGMTRRNLFRTLSLRTLIALGLCGLRGHHQGECLTAGLRGTPALG